MSTSIDLFQPWSKRQKLNYKKVVQGKVCVVYTRVSSKEQFETNLSLDWQKKAIDEFATRNEFAIAGYFGGTYESASSDGRKEFLRMMDFIKKNKDRVTHVLVYLLDRFSRTGDGAMRLAKELRNKYGVTIIAVTQPIDTSNPGGVFQQNMQFLFSEYDNQLRRQRTIAGLREKLERGIWCIKHPMGYSVIKDGKDRRLVVNETGRNLRKAFEWKSQGMKNDEILSRLKAMGVNLYRQKLSMIFSNPFYCGIIAHKLLNGRLVEGTHEKLVTQELFLRIHDIRAEAGGKYGVSHKKENREYPLKLFMKCDICGSGYTGYVVRKKYKTSGKEDEFHYYKCRTRGCNCNQNTQEVNEAFVRFLSQYAIQPQFIGPLLAQMNHAFDKHYAAAIQEQKILKDKLTEIDKKIDHLEEDYYVERKVPTETYDRLQTKLADEKKQILESLTKTDVEGSNLKEYYETAIQFSEKLAAVWASSEVSVKEQIQKMIFPEGVRYNREKGEFLTDKVNEVFAQIASLNNTPGGDKEKQEAINDLLSCSVGMTGFEPAASSSRTKRATGLRYIP